MNEVVVGLLVASLVMVLGPNVPALVRAVAANPLVASIVIAITGGGFAVGAGRLAIVSFELSHSIAFVTYALALILLLFVKGVQKGFSAFRLGVVLIGFGQAMGIVAHIGTYGTGLLTLGVQVVAEALGFVVALRVAGQGHQGAVILRAVYWSAWPIMAVSLAVGAFGVPQAFLGESLIGVPAFEQGRLSGITTHPNGLGSLALVMFLTRLALRESLPRMLALGFLPLLAIVMSGMRSALAGALLGFAAYLFLRFRSPLARAVSLVVAGLGLLTVPLVLQAAETIVTARSESVGSRQFLWEFLLARSDSYLPVGLGPSGVYHLSLSSGILPEIYFHAHNQALTHIVGGGVIALVGVVLVLSALMVSLRRSATSVVVLSGMLPLMLFESPLHTGMAPRLQPVAVAVWVLIALAAVGRNPSWQRPSAPSATPVMRPAAGV